MVGKISVIVTSYNYERYISETIQSVLNQTVANWELIIVDDGSKDNSVELIKSFCEKDERIKLYQHKNCENKGLAESLKLGIKKANSEWIVFLESDDSITPDYLEEKINIVKQYPSVNLIFNDINMFGDDCIINEFNSNYFTYQKSVFENIEFPTKLYKILKNKKRENLIPTFSCVMIKKNLLHNINYNSPLKPVLDYFIWLQLAQKCVIYYINKKLTNWRMHKGFYINSSIDDKKMILFCIYRELFLKGNVLYVVFMAFKFLRRKIIRLSLKNREIVLWGKKYKLGR